MIKIDDNIISSNSKTYIIAEIGINHNGELKNALELIDVAKNSGADAVKFQKRTPKIATPKRYWKTKKITPWGELSYIDYKIETELSLDDYNIINDYCKKKRITWFASCWDIQSVKDLHDFDLPCYKIASASITDLKLLSFISSLKKPIFMSTGMSSEKQISTAYNKIKKNLNVIMHCNSEYPSKYQDLNLKYINKLKKKFKNSIIGYSGHEISLIPTVAAVVLGAKVVERHVTLDKSLWGSDHSCSLEPLGLNRLVKEIRIIERSLGSEKKVVTSGEKLMIKKLRKYK